MPEWAKEQQVILLFQSFGLGVFLGLLFDVFSVPVKMCRRRRFAVFFIDVTFLAVSSLVTFYFSLATMDGRLHPLLFGGCLFGFVLQHITVGRFIGLWLYRIVRFGRVAVVWVTQAILLPFRLLFDWLRRVFRSVFAGLPKKAQKTRKKASFFQKKS